MYCVFALSFAARGVPAGREREPQLAADAAVLPLARAGAAPGQSPAALAGARCGGLRAPGESLLIFLADCVLFAA